MANKIDNDESLVLTKILEKNIEAYPAISTNKKNYDITVVRVKVKSTELQNESKNNATNKLSPKNFNFLVLVVIEENQNRYFVLTKEEVEREISPSSQLYVSEKNGEKYCVKENIVAYEDKWEKISSGLSA